MTKAEREQKMRDRLVEMQEYERALRAKGVQYIGGVDEVGRGPLAGPVVTACVVLPEDFDVLGVDDSKKISEKRRESLYDAILERAIAYGIGIRSSKVIDEINILEATKEAMIEAVEKADAMLAARISSGEITEASCEVSDGSTEPIRDLLGEPTQVPKVEHLLIDAVELKKLDRPQTPIVKGDATSLSIAAASIVAKVTRDRMMVEYANEYPGYAWEKNKGYGTKAHYEGLRNLGMTPIHRRSFLKNL